MEAGHVSASNGYGKPPWRFNGSALYQLHLVKSDIARALIPKDFRLVEAFGYTLGGFFFANYDHSPAGVFDEDLFRIRQHLVLDQVLALTWSRQPRTHGLTGERLNVAPDDILIYLLTLSENRWASKVLVNSSEACHHGRKDVGLPSHVASFSKLQCCLEQRVTANMRQNESGHESILKRMGLSSSASSSRFHLETEVTESSGSAGSADNIFRISLLSAVPKESSKEWMGHAVKMSLPSFSGRTKHNPNLLKYSCQLECRVRVVQPLQIFGPSLVTETNYAQRAEKESQETTEKTSRLSLSVMLSRPILALEFNCLSMKVEAPLVVSHSY